jgi:hypothetical protein
MRLQRWLFDHFRNVGALCGFEAGTPYKGREST